MYKVVIAGMMMGLGKRSSLSLYPQYLNNAMDVAGQCL